LIKIEGALSSEIYDSQVTSTQGGSPMFDFLFSLFEFNDRKNMRYGARWNPFNMDNGALGMEEPTVDTARQDYYQENSPSAERERKRQSRGYNGQK